MPRRTSRWLSISSSVHATSPEFARARIQAPARMTDRQILPRKKLGTGRPPGVINWIDCSTDLLAPDAVAGCYKAATIARSSRPYDKDGAAIMWEFWRE